MTSLPESHVRTGLLTESILEASREGKKMHASSEHLASSVSVEIKSSRGAAGSLPGLGFNPEEGRCLKPLPSLFVLNS